MSIVVIVIVIPMPVCHGHICIPHKPAAVQVFMRILSGLFVRIVAAMIKKCFLNGSLFSK